MITWGAWAWGWMLACSTPAPPLVVGQLPPCPETPNCASSGAAPGAASWVEPLPWAPDPLLHHAVRAMGCRVERAERGWLWATCQTPWLRFTDDLVLLTQGEQVQVWSASRVGRSDLGVNHHRVGALRLVLAQLAAEAEAAAPSPAR